MKLNIPSRCVVVAVVVFYILATVLCTGGRLYITNRQLRKLKRLAVHQQQPLQTHDDLAMEDRQLLGTKAKVWTNSKLQKELKKVIVKVASLDTSVVNMRSDFKR